MKYIYSASNNAFYPIELQETYEQARNWPTDGVEIDNVMFAKFSGVAPEGKVRAADAEGFPCWTDILPLSTDELIAIAEAEKKYLLTAANTAIAPLADAVEFDIATAAERQLYDAWRRYRVLLTRVDTAAAPVSWPIQPQ